MACGKAWSPAHGALGPSSVEFARSLPRKLELRDVTGEWAYLRPFRHAPRFRAGPCATIAAWASSIAARTSRARALRSAIRSPGYPWK